MLWMAVRSPRLIAAILITTLAGLLSATALGLLIFQKFNVISVAFIPLFVGLGIDFGIQFTVRFRSELALDLTVEEAILRRRPGHGPIADPGGRRHRLGLPRLHARPTMSASPSWASSRAWA